MPSTRYLAGAVPSGLLRRSPIQRETYNNFTGGWHPEKPLSKLLPDELSNVLNVEFPPGGGIRKRGGMEAFTNPVTDLDDIQFLFAPRVETVDDPEAAAPFPIFRQIVFTLNRVDGSIYYQSFAELARNFFDSPNGSDFTDSGHSLGPGGGNAFNFFRTWPVSVIVWEDKVYMTCLRYNGFSGGSGSGGVWETQDGSPGTPSLPLKYDAQSDTFSRPTVPDLHDSDDTGFPRARTMIAAFDRVYVANVHKQGAYRFPSRIYWSEAGDPESWPENNWLAVGNDDGAEITRLLVFGDQIIVFKNTSVYTLVGTSEENFALYLLDNHIGTEGTYAATSNRDAVWFFDTLTATVWQYDGAKFVNIGEPVTEYLRGTLNHAAVSQTVLQVFDNYLWLSYPALDESPAARDENTETLVYDLRIGAWSRWDFGVVPNIVPRLTDFIADESPAAFNVFEGDSYAYFVNTDSAHDDVVTVGYFGDRNVTEYQDYGANYNFNFRTAWFSPDRGENRKRARRVELLVPSDNGEVTVDLYRNFQDAVWSTFDFEADDSLEYHLMQSSVDVNEMFNWISFNMSASHNNPVEISEVLLNWSLRGTKRGDVGGTNYGG